jgi:NAD(P)-dependent dehydrogenase (short-subunit alcohol dehydrogenase family)
LEVHKLDNPNVVLVTGSSSGFGELIVATVARAGHTVFATMRASTSRNAPAAERLQKWSEDEGLNLRVLEMDVADTESVNAAVDQVLATQGRIDVVVNNAAIAAAGPIEAFDIEQMQELYDINVFGPMRVDKAVLPQMRDRGSGLVIHVSSTLGRILPNSGGLYPASKWAVEGLAESLHYQLKPFGVELVILEPGSFPTPAISKGLRPNDVAVAEAYAAAPQTTRRPTQPGPDYTPPDPQEIADEVLRLIELPQGHRPMRTVVGPIFTTGVAEFNAAYERARDELTASLQRPDQAIIWGRT